MAYRSEFEAEEPGRSELDASTGLVLVEFGASWCGYCRAAQPAIAMALEGRDDVSHVKIEDGRGRRLGRTFGVKLWPTLVLLGDGVELGRTVRPASVEDISALLAQRVATGCDEAERPQDGGPKRDAGQDGVGR